MITGGTPNPGGKKILFIAAPGAIPAQSTSGTPMIFTSIINTFADQGWSIGYLCLLKDKNWADDDELHRQAKESPVSKAVRYWIERYTYAEPDRAAAETVIEEFEPDVIYCLGHRAANTIVDAKTDAYRICTFYDSQHMGQIEKILYLLRWNRPRTWAWALIALPYVWAQYKEHAQKEIPILKKMDLTISHSHDTSLIYKRKLGTNVGYFPNPLEVVEPLERVEQNDAPPTFMLSGAVNSTVSYTGLKFFLDEVLPHLRQELENDEIQIKITGGGRLSKDLYPLRDIPNVHLMGYLSHEDLLKEYQIAKALIVPTPIKMGFRTRIMDAFRRGVPTIVHSANQAGFRELEHNKNCLMVSNGRDMAELIKQTAKGATNTGPIAQQALEEFQTRYSVGHFVDYIKKLVSENSAKPW